MPLMGARKTRQFVRCEGLAPPVRDALRVVQRHKAVCAVLCTCTRTAQRPQVCAEGLGDWLLQTDGLATAPHNALRVASLHVLGQAEAHGNGALHAPLHHAQRAQRLIHLLLVHLLQASTNTAYTS